MIRPSRHPVVIARDLRHAGWAAAEQGGPQTGYTVELRRDGRVVSVTAPTSERAWRLVERCVLGG